jgi:hypothetical protein
MAERLTNLLPYCLLRKCDIDKTDKLGMSGVVQSMSGISLCFDFALEQALDELSINIINIVFINQIRLLIA